MNEAPAAQLIELFSSVQGEGPLVGMRQAFLRFAGCNLQCSYCDTQLAIQPNCLIEATPGHGDLRPTPNPVALETVLAVLQRWNRNSPGLHQALSITGGEPLLAVDTLVEWLPVLKQQLPILLETNGTLPAALARVRPWLSYVSMDIKLPSTSGLPAQWEVHREFLQASAGVETYVKVVVGATTSDGEVEQSAQLIRSVDSTIPLILQPQSPSAAQSATMTALRLLDLQALASRILSQVRIIPQTHKFIGVL